MVSSFITSFSDKFFWKDTPDYQRVSEQEKQEIMQSVYERGDRFMHLFFLVHSIIAVGLAFFYDTWFVTAVVGIAAVSMFLISAYLLPRHFLTRCIAGLSLQLFVALHIYQMHGLAEMHFFFFTGYTMMLIYQDGKSLWPGAVFIILQHTVFAIYHNEGVVPLYFFEDNYVSVVKLAFHFGIVVVQVVICGYWAYALRRNTIQSVQRNRSLEQSNEELQIMITKQYEAEQQLQQSYNKAEEYRLLLQSILDASPDWIFAKDRDFRITLASRGFADSLNMDVRSMQGKTDDELGFSHEQIYGAPEKGIRGFRVDDKAAMAGETIRNNYDPATPADGETKVFDTIKVPIRNAEGQIIGALGMARDVTEIRNKEEELHKARDEAQAANRAKSEFLANMSHEIRTPMNAILGFAEILLGKLENTDFRRYVEAIYSGGKSLLTIINDILDLSKIEAGKLELEYRPVNLIRLLEELRTFFHIRLEEKQLQFKMDIDPALPSSLLIDEVRIRQILVNLVGNAVKFTDTGYVRVRIIVADADNLDSDVRLVIEVEDTGIGIPEDQLPKILEAFYQHNSKTVKKYGGTGLGLSITRRLVEIMGGMIQLESAEGKGSLFRVILPQVHIGSTDPAAVVMENIDVTFSPATILLVDDNEINRDLIKEYLAPHQFVIHEADNGATAVEMAIDLVPDVVLMDVKMPEMDGYTATNLITSNQKTTDVPIIALTASAMLGDRQVAFKHGCSGFLSKPVSRLELLSELMRFIPSTAQDMPANAGASAGSAEQEPQLLNAQAGRELLRLLETTYMPRWEELQLLLMPDEIRHFADDLLEVSNLYPVSVVQDFARTLQQQAGGMHFVHLEKTLHTFPGVLDQLRRLSQKEKTHALPQ